MANKPFSTGPFDGTDPESSQRTASGKRKRSFFDAPEPEPAPSRAADDEAGDGAAHWIPPEAVRPSQRPFGPAWPGADSETSKADAPASGLVSACLGACEPPVDKPEDKPSAEASDTRVSSEPPRKSEPPSPASAEPKEPQPSTQPASSKPVQDHKAPESDQTRPAPPVDTVSEPIFPLNRTAATATQEELEASEPPVAAAKPSQEPAPVAAHEDHKPAEQTTAAYDSPAEPNESASEPQRSGSDELPADSDKSEPKSDSAAAPEAKAPQTEPESASADSEAEPVPLAQVVNEPKASKRSRRRAQAGRSKGAPDPAPGKLVLQEDTSDDAMDEEFFLRGEEVDREHRRVSEMPSVLDEPAAAPPASKRNDPRLIERRRRLRRVVAYALAPALLVGTVAVAKALVNGADSEPVAAAPATNSAQQVAPPAPKPQAAAPIVTTAPSQAPVASAEPAASAEPVASAAPEPSASAATPEQAAVPAIPDGVDPAKETLRLLNAGKYKDTIPMAQAAIAQHPEDANLYLYLGTALQMIGRNKEAIEAYSQCVHTAKKGPIAECRAVGGK